MQIQDFRIHQHPILSIPTRTDLDFYWEEKSISAKSGETIAAALFANGIRIFGHHPKDNSPQGIICANGQCSQCLVIADGKPVKSCMELVQPGMHVCQVNSLPVLPAVSHPPSNEPIQEIQIPVLIIGGGPAGLSAAIELGKLGIKTILLDDKHKLGGKLVLQTHRFFGSTNTVYAGTRGIDIAFLLENELRKYAQVEVWLQSTALAVFSDQKVGVLKNAKEYILVHPQVILVASGAREKFLAFRGNTLPGVYGAGAFQTLVNRDLVRPAERLFIVGGGNVGLIAGYHALQAGITVVGLVEALPQCGGYKVHEDKLARMGVPIFTSHTILSANGKDLVDSVTIAAVDASFHPIPGTEKSFQCDSVLIAVGLDPVNEFLVKAQDFDIPAYAAGDAEEIAEASAAIISGKIKGREIARHLGEADSDIPADWYRTVEILKSKPGISHIEDLPEVMSGVTPVIHCNQEIPCDPCTALCPNGLISIEGTDIRNIPCFLGNEDCCQVCEQCVAGCPGLAITLVDYRSNPELPIVSIPYEFNLDLIKEKTLVTVMDTAGNCLGKLEVMGVHSITTTNHTLIIQVQAPVSYARQIAGICVQDANITQAMDQYVKNLSDETIVCRCERVSAGEIRSLIREGYRDINEIKAVTRAGMGACGSKTCNAIIHRVFLEEGISTESIVDNTKRPLFIEVPLGIFAGDKG